MEFPGLFDLQVNGFARRRLQRRRDLHADDLARRCDGMRATGVTRCLPTLITAPLAISFARSARVLAALHRPDRSPGIHMEGPYLSREDGARGAHPREHVIAATVDDFARRQEAADGRIVLVTLAPGGAGRARR